MRISQSLKQCEVVDQIPVQLTRKHKQSGDRNWAWDTIPYFKTGQIISQIRCRTPVQSVNVHNQYRKGRWFWNTIVPHTTLSYVKQWDFAEVWHQPVKARTEMPTGKGNNLNS